MSRNIFSTVDSVRPGRSVFDLSNEVIFDCYAGDLIPILHREVVPGDVFKIANEIVVRLMPLVAPILHAIDITVHYFFVPYRLLWTLWEDFITGGVLGTDASVIPRWDAGAAPAKGQIWDYLGYPLVRPLALDRPTQFALRAYYLIFNEYYRDETLQTEIDIHTGLATSWNHVIVQRAWRKDYFTSALPWQQRGTAPALPIYGSSQAIFASDVALGWPAASTANPTALNIDSVTNVPSNAADKTALEKGKALKTGLDNNTVALGSATSVNIADLRTSVQIQKWMERNARAGVRYTEFLKEHFSVAPRDERLQRPEYIGGSKQPLIVSEVLKTSTDGSTPQGSMVGHGLSAAANRIAKYKATEYGMIMGIMSIMPRPVYNSQGFFREDLRRSKYDFYFPEFAHLAEQAIEREELYANGVEADNRAVWGYQGRYDELRIGRNYTACNVRDTLAYWAMARTFASAPTLTSSFITCDGKTDPTNNPLTKVFAAPSVPGYLVHFGNNIVASRPLPIASNPGLMDHF